MTTYHRQGWMDGDPFFCSDFFVPEIDKIRRVVRSVKRDYIPSSLSFYLPTNLHTFYIPIYLPSYLSTYLPTYLHTFYIPIYLPSYLPIFLPIYLPTYLSNFPTYLPYYLPAYLPSYLSTLQPIYLPTYLPSCLSTFLPTLLPIETFKCQTTKRTISIPSLSCFNNRYRTDLLTSVTRWLYYLLNIWPFRAMKICANRILFYQSCLAKYYMDPNFRQIQSHCYQTTFRTFLDNLLIRQKDNKTFVFIFYLLKLEKAVHSYDVNLYDNCNTYDVIELPN